MSDKKQQVWESLEDPDYRREWAAEHVSVGLAFQIRALRESRGWTQSELGACTGKAQETVSQLENPNYGRLTISTLKKLAAAFDVGLLVRFVPFSELVNWAVDVTPKQLAPPRFAAELVERERLTSRETGGAIPSESYIFRSQTESSSGLVIYDIEKFRQLKATSSSNRGEQLARRR